MERSPNSLHRCSWWEGWLSPTRSGRELMERRQLPAVHWRSEWRGRANETEHSRTLKPMELTTQQHLQGIIFCHEALAGSETVINPDCDQSDRGRLLKNMPSLCPDDCYARCQTNIKPS